MSTAKNLSKHAVHISWDGHEKIVSIERDSFVLGRDPACDVHIDHPEVSRRHLAVRIAAGKVYVKDMGSKGGSFLGGKALKAFHEVPCEVDDKIELSEVVTVVIAPESRAPVRSSGEKQDAPSARLAVVPPVTVAKASSTPGNPKIAAPPLSNRPITTGAVPVSQKHHDEAALKDSAAHEARELRRRAMLEVESVQANAVKFAESIREEARREADKAREQARVSAEKLREEARQQAEALRESLSKGVDRAKEDIARLTAEKEKIAVECREAAEKASSIRLEIETDRAKRKAEKLEHESVVRVFEAELGTLKEEKATVEKSVQALREVLDRLQASHVDLELQDQNGRKRLAELNEQHRQAGIEFDNLTARLAEIREEIDREGKQLEEMIAHRKETEETHSVADRKRQALTDTLEAEFQVRKLRFEAAVGEIDLKRIEAEQHLKSVEGRAKQIEEELGRREAESERRLREAEQKLKFDADKLEKLSRDQARTEGELARLKGELGHAADELKKLHVATDEARLAAATAEQERQKAEARARSDREQFARELVETRERLQREEREIHERLEREERETREKLDQAVHEAQQKFMQDTAASRERLEREEGEARETLARELAAEREQFERDKAQAQTQLAEELTSARQATLDSIERELTAQKQALEADRMEKMRKLERELADAKLRETEKINRMVEEEKRVQRTRVQFMVDEITNTAVSIARGASLDDPATEVRKAVKAVLEGKTVATTTAEGAERTRQFWRRAGLIAAGPVAIILFLLIFPKAPGQLLSAIKREIASYQAADNSAFLAEIRQRGMKYQPPRNYVYRGTYADNILYLDGYIEMKLDDAEHKTWTLLVNDFLTGRLGLSDAVVADFVAAEAVLVRELIKVRENILPQYKDQGLARLATVEKEETEKMRTILQHDENLQKFRALEKSYYEDYLKRRPKGEPAN